MKVGIACAKSKKPMNWLRKKESRQFQKIFLDSHSHFGNHDLVIALQTTASMTVLTCMTSEYIVTRRP